MPAPLIGVLGGTFDPIHYGHLRPALEVQETLGLAEVRFIPLGVAVHRGQPATPAALRLEMVRAALAGQPGLLADDRELHRGGRSYTLDTLVDLRRERPESHLCLLVGGDAFNAFLTWHRPLEILGLAHLALMQRPGSPDPSNPALTALLAERQCREPRRLLEQSAGRIWTQPVTQLAISSSAIRARIAAGADPRFLLPDPVLAIIRRQGLYR
jgi:nicotinate-nucleotide adenylyltransferase